MTTDPGREEFRSAFDVSRETMDLLGVYVQELARWSARINLVAPSTLQEAWRRHILDSAQLFALARPTVGWADLGSGGGLPGLVVAILAREKWPDMQMHLVESDRRKATFLRQMAARFQLKVQVHADRAENLAPIGAGVVSARALAPLPRLLPLVRRHLAPGGTALIPKGRQWRAEVEDCNAATLGPFTVHQSRVDPDSVVLELTGLKP